MTCHQHPSPGEVDPEVVGEHDLVVLLREPRGNACTTTGRRAPVTNAILPSIRNRGRAEVMSTKSRQSRP
jgi:hypothetical protein